MSLLQFNNSFCSVRGEIRSLLARKCIYIILNTLRVRATYYPPAPQGEKGKVPLPLLAQLSPLSLLRSSEQRLLIDNQPFTLRSLGDFPRGYRLSG